MGDVTSYFSGGKMILVLLVVVGYFAFRFFSKRKF